MKSTYDSMYYSLHALVILLYVLWVTVCDGVHLQLVMCQFPVELLMVSCACKGQKQPCLPHDQPAVDLGENMSYTPAQNLPAYRSVAARHFSIQC